MNCSVLPKFQQNLAKLAKPCTEDNSSMIWRYDLCRRPIYTLCRSQCQKCILYISDMVSRTDTHQWQGFNRTREPTRSTLIFLCSATEDFFYFLFFLISAFKRPFQRKASLSLSPVHSCRKEFGSLMSADVLQSNMILHLCQELQLEKE